MRGLGLVKDIKRHRKHHRRRRKSTRPIYVRDVADVKIGAELRQGAVTANGEGEAVAGIVHDAQRRERARCRQRGERKSCPRFKRRCRKASSLCRSTIAPIS